MHYPYPDAYPDDPATQLIADNPPVTATAVGWRNTSVVATKHLPAKAKETLEALVRDRLQSGPRPTAREYGTLIDITDRLHRQPRRRPRPPRAM